MALRASVAPQAEQAQHQQPFAGAGARIGGGSGHGQHRQRPPAPHAHAPLGRCTRSARTHSQSRDHTPSAISRCLLVALAQVAHRLTGVDG